MVMPLGVTSAILLERIHHSISIEISGGFRNLERGVQPLAREAQPKNLGTEYLEATLGLVNRLEISKELICDCVTVPGCCCCIPLLYNHLMDSCSYLCKNKLDLLAAKPLPKSATGNTVVNSFWNGIRSCRSSYPWTSCTASNFVVRTYNFY